ncbi:class I SAM-dependent methyltransferase [Actinopolymorpha sp. B9G3]|uniref:class I SAM-dependent methyltransferase n=1 Tax=Actinopolymorpha sp. B9G3 TaxID=3158970 RepID=UPI0032D99E38
MDTHTTVNQRLWDELAPLHAASDYYDVESFVQGAETLEDTEVREVGDVTGKRLAHLMCHFGMDSLSWARHGASVTGLDFSRQAVDIARTLATRTGVEAEFVCADVMAAADVLDGTFDVVFLSKGVMMWIETVSAWAQVCARLLKPGGVFYLLEFHPLAMVMSQTEDGLALQGSYFHSPDPEIVVSDGSYAVSEPGLAHQESREWTHSVGEIVTALVDAGIRIDFLHEFRAAENAFTTVSGTKVPTGTSLPAAFSVRGTRT